MNGGKSVQDCGGMEASHESTERPKTMPRLSLLAL
jgi:hypothetical protein